MFSKKIFFRFSALILFLAVGRLAQAQSSDKISVFHADGTAFSAKPLVLETNVLPGDEFTRRFYVVKKDKLDQALMMHFKRRLSARENILARRMYIRLKRVSDGKFLHFPNGRMQMNLASLYLYRNPRNSDAFYFDKISGPVDSEHEYDLIFTFDPKAGNRFQKRMTKFDLSVGIFSKPTNVCRSCFCFWRNFCCHPQEWHCRWVGYLFGFR